MQKIVALTVFYKWWGLNVYLPNTFKSEKVFWNNRIITSNRKKLKPILAHDHKQNQALCGAFKCHKSTNKYLLKIPPWFKKGTGSTANILSTGINKNNLDKNCKVNSECKNRTGYKCMRNKFFNNSSKQKRDNIKDGLLMFGYSNASLKNLKNGTYIENEVPIKKHSSIKNKCKYYESVFGVYTVSDNSAQNSDEKNYNLVNEKDGHHDKPSTDVDPKYYFENYGNEKVQSVPKSLVLKDDNNIQIQLSDFVQKVNINSKNSGCLLLNYNALNGQEINIKINFGKLWSAFSNKNRQIIKAMAGGILSLNCKFPVLVNKATGNSGKPIKHKTVFYLSEEPKTSDDLVLKIKGTKEVERKIDTVDKIDSLTNTKYTNNDNNKNNENKDLHLLSSFKIEKAPTCSFNISDNNDMTLSLKTNSSNDETGKTKQRQKKGHKHEKQEHLNDKDLTEMTSNISKCENRNLMNKVKMKISDTSSNDHIKELVVVPSKKLKPSKQKEKNVTQLSEFNSKILTQSNYFTKCVDLNKSKSRDPLVKTKHPNLLSFSNINSKDAKMVKEWVIIEECEKNGQLNESKQADILEKEDAILLSESNINSKMKQNVEERINRDEGSEKSDQLNVNKYLILLETKNRNQVPVSNITPKCSQNIEEGSQKIENNDRALLNKENEDTLSAININSKLYKRINKKVSVNDQLNASKFIALTKTEDRNTPAGSNINSKVAKVVEEGIPIIEACENGQVNGSKHTDLLEKKDRFSLCESDVNSKMKQNVEEGMNGTEGSEKNDKLYENKYTILLKTETRNQVPQSNTNSKLSHNIEQGSQMIENHNRALLKIEDVDMLSTANVNSKLENESNRTEFSKNEELNASKYITLMQIADRNTPSGSNINSKDVDIFEEGITIIEDCEKNDQLNRSKRIDLLEKEDGILLSESNINSMMKQNDEEGINGNEDFKKIDQLHENKYIIFLTTENRNPVSESNTNSKIPHNNEEASQKIENYNRYLLQMEGKDTLSTSNIIRKLAQTFEEGINIIEGTEKSGELNENKSTALLLKNENENKLPESTINPKVSQSVEQGIIRTESSEQTDQHKENICAAVSLKNKKGKALSESTINSRVLQSVEQGINRTAGSEQTDHLNENICAAVSLKNKKGKALSESTINPKVSQSVEQGINRTTGSKQTYQLNENICAAVSLKNKKGKALSESTITPKVSQSVEQGINKTAGSGQTDQLIENKCGALLLKNENEKALSESTINSKVSQSVEQGINRTAGSGQTDQLNENICAAVSLKNKKGKALSESTITPKVSQSVEQGINRTAGSGQTYQLNENICAAVSLKNKKGKALSESTITPKVSQSVEQGINKTAGSGQTDQLNENKCGVLLLKNENEKALSESTINSKVSQSVEQGINRTAGSGQTDQLNENICAAVSLKNKKGKALSESTITPKVSQSVEQGINRTAGSGQTYQLNENICAAVSLKNKKGKALSESTITPKVSQSVEQGINKTAGSGQTDQLNENKCGALLLKNENEKALSESTINSKVSQSVEQGINRTAGSGQTDQLNENKCGSLLLKNENDKALSESTINPKVSQSVEQGINRSERSEQTDQLNENICAALSLKNENGKTLSESTINSRVLQSVEQGINRTEGSEQTDQLNENICAAGSLKNKKGKALSESTITPKVSQSVEQGSNITEGSEQTDQRNENICAAHSLKNKNENMLYKLNIKSDVRHPVPANRRKNFPSLGDDDITISSVSNNTQTDQSKVPIKMKINPSPINIKLKSLVKNVLSGAKDNGIITQQTKGSEVTYSKTVSSSSGTDTQPNIYQKTEKQNITISGDTLIPENAIKNVNTSCIKEKLKENSYNITQSKTDSDETRNKFHKRVNEGEKLIKSVNSIVDNKISNCFQHNKKMKRLFRKRRPDSSVHDSGRTSAVRKSVEQNIKTGTNIILDLNTNSKENYNVVKENSLNKKFIPDYYETKLYNCASGGSPSEILFEQSKNRFGNSVALAQLRASRHAEQKEKIGSKHLKKKVYPINLLISTTVPHDQPRKTINIMRPKGNHLSQVSNNLRTKSKLSLHSQTKLLSTMSQNKPNDDKICSLDTKGANETRCIAASPSSMVAQISELPRITQKQPIIESDLQKKAKESDNVCHDERDPDSYKPLSPSPSSMITKLKAIKLKKINKNDGGFIDESEPTPCNDNSDQFSNTKKPTNRQNGVDRNENLNRSLLHTNNVKQQIFKCPDTDNKCKIDISGKLKDKLDTLKELFNNNLNCLKEKLEASCKKSKPTICPSNTVLKMLQEKAKSRKNKQATKSVNKQRYCIPSYSEILKHASKER